MVTIRENPIKMDNLGVPLFLETLKSWLPIPNAETPLSFHAELLCVALRWRLFPKKRPYLEDHPMTDVSG